MIGEPLRSLYDLARSNAGKGNSAEGYQFENFVHRRLYEVGKACGIKVFPPRYAPQIPTLSGVKYQIDASFEDEGVSYFIECKKREWSANDQVYYFNGKILDYKLASRQPERIKGVFLSTAVVDETPKIYAMTFGMIVIDPESPSVEQMMLNPGSTNLAIALQRHMEKAKRNQAQIALRKNPTHPPADLLKEYRFLVGRWDRDSRKV